MLLVVRPQPGQAVTLGENERKPSASVLVELYPGRNLEPSQVMAIINLVATSVPELTKSQITVVDQKGNLLSDQQGLTELSMAGKQFDYTVGTMIEVPRGALTADASATPTRRIMKRHVSARA